ncbi:MAG: tRNA pseudouridine synthase A [Gammaproteobacteria bacterium]|nr:tRNA pseudouridine synthase A [Gammaproteobacteria bacterium]
MSDGFQHAYGACGIEYRGTHFQGWQRLRKDGRNVQSCVETALSRVADHEVTTACAGRTDSGVHARYQVVHFDTEAERDMHGWVLGCNTHLPGDVSVLWAQPVEDRSCAVLGDCPHLPLLYSQPHGAAGAAARSGNLGMPATGCHAHAGRCRKRLIGEHDFSGYRALSCQSTSPVRHVRRLTVCRQDEYIVIAIEANAFVHHMVRNIAGVLMTIGKGKADVAWSAEILAGR